MIGGIVLGLVLLVVRYLPAVDRVKLATAEIALPARHDKTIPAVALVCVVVLVLLTGHNIFSTYIAPWLIGVGGIAPDQVAAVLFLYGGAGALGLFAAGLVSDRVPRAGFLVTVVLVAVSVTILALGSGLPWLLLVGMGLWGAAFGGLPSMMQSRLLQSASPRIRDLSSAFLTTSFNIGIGGGALDRRAAARSHRHHGAAVGVPRRCRPRAAHRDRRRRGHPAAFRRAGRHEVGRPAAGGALAAGALGGDVSASQRRGCGRS